ncbi:TRASH domain-containing protein [Candidatus Pacearchaeota archaeon]|nr:TRASH domain-containing protein [Candidatus Pacearchaeota archaeon]
MSHAWLLLLIKKRSYYLCCNPCAFVFLIRCIF